MLFCFNSNDLVSEVYFRPFKYFCMTPEDLLESKKVRITAMRLLVLKFILETNRAVTLSDIENAFDYADRTTLYRTLLTFEEAGIVHHIDDGSGTNKYAICEEGCNCELDKDLHLHFHCNQCGETVCFTDHKLPHLRVPDGYIAENVNLVIKGICKKCSGL